VDRHSAIPVTGHFLEQTMLQVGERVRTIDDDHRLDVLAILQAVGQEITPSIARHFANSPSVLFDHETCFHHFVRFGEPEDKVFTRIPCSDFPKLQTRIE